ncbi:sigma-E factor negative regulatory protein [Permianibacter sp. IMCC34836]|uniref:sigma-E factor negative regulatory protein n=1 Tax=Permianibacter fluminis TaxID=2738515 RepID=UPI001555C00A|nr:sigma-E factor negative regulatory protein [Permianibacter fluminis]NQD37352.1 sigma-E factor negative regulatory protein [Permianibacter fluminis]
MSEHQRLQLSALMDGDVPSAPELERLLANQPARAVWGRYHLIRDAVQNELPEQYCDLSSSISLALADEPTVLAPRPRPVTAWQKAVGFAVAASVFAVAIVSFQSFQPNDAAVASSAESAPTMMVAAPVSQVADAPVVVDDERARLEDMLINHTEAVSANGLNVMLPYARVVSDRIDVSIDEQPVEELPTEAAPVAPVSHAEQVQP